MRQNDAVDVFKCLPLSTHCGSGTICTSGCCELRHGPANGQLDRPATRLIVPYKIMQSDISSTGSKEPPPERSISSLKQFHSAGRGYWRDVSDSDWNDWHWQMKHRIHSVEMLQKLLPTLSPEELAGAQLANHKLALGITPY